MNTDTILPAKNKDPHEINHNLKELVLKIFLPWSDFVRGFLVVESEIKLKLWVRENGVRVLGEEETKPTMAIELLEAKL